MILSKTIHNEKIHYIDSDDDIIRLLKSNILFGYENWIFLNDFILENPDSYIVDCGAHIGTFSFIPAKIQKRKTILIDAASKNIECLRKTFHNTENVEIHHKILLDKKRQCSFDSDYGPFGLVNLDKNLDRISSTIDDIVGTRKICAIKLDIEGSEPEAILGAKNTLEKNTPPILVEVNGHCLRLNNKKPKHLFDVLESFEYEYFLQDQEKRLIYFDKNTIFPFCVTDILCIHKSKISFMNKKYKICNKIPQKELLEIAKVGFEIGNQDCKNYFLSLNEEYHFL